jgi:hypothetical protein
MLKENVLLVLVYGRINWIVTRQDEFRIQIMAAPGWSILHPLFFPIQQLRLDSDSFMLSVGMLGFVAPPGDPDLNVVQRFLRNLRYASRQPELPIEVAGYKINMDEIPSEPVFSEVQQPLCHVQKYLLQTAVRDADIRAAAAYPIDFEPPVYEEIYLEAVRAAREDDHRKAVLYSAIAIESCAQLIIQNAYDFASQSTQPSIAMRFVNFNTTQGQAIKDPVYRFMVDRAKFSTWLHELPLYILTRSMLIDDQALYDQALSLSKIRNKLAHSGQVPKEDDIIPLDTFGSYEAVGIAARCLTWFGVPGEFPNPQVKFEPIAETAG